MKIADIIQESGHRDTSAPLMENIKTRDLEQLSSLKQQLAQRRAQEIATDNEQWAKDFYANNPSRVGVISAPTAQSEPEIQQSTVSNRMGKNKKFTRAQKLTYLENLGKKIVGLYTKYEQIIDQNPHLKALSDNVVRAWTSRLENPDASPQTEQDYDRLIELYDKFYGQMLEFIKLKKAATSKKLSPIRRSLTRPSKAVVTKF
jgi:hypothetical protein